MLSRTLLGSAVLASLVVMGAMAVYNPYPDSKVRITGAGIEDTIGIGPFTAALSPREEINDEDPRVNDSMASIPIVVPYFTAPASIKDVSTEKIAEIPVTKTLDADDGNTASAPEVAHGNRSTAG